MAQEETPEIVALRLRLQIAEAERDRAQAEAQSKAVAAAAQASTQEELIYLLPRDFEEVVSADLFPRDGVGRQGSVLPLRLENDLAIAEYSKRKSKHQVWTYRRSRTAAAYLELVVSALQDVSADQRAFVSSLAPQEGFAYFPAHWHLRSCPPGARCLLVARTPSPLACGKFPLAVLLRAR